MHRGIGRGGDGSGGGEAMIEAILSIIGTAGAVFIMIMLGTIAAAVMVVGIVYIKGILGK